ncbi:MAG: nucleotidyltransferase family protein [Chloroflexota bacterium]
MLKRHGVRRAGIFGSFARGEAGRSSDLDVAIEFEGEKSLLDLIGLKLDLEDALGLRVDVVTYDSLHPAIKRAVLREQQVIV